MIIAHRYFVYATGIKNFKPRCYDSRVAAESYMHAVCKKYNITNLECYERDRHERAYTNHSGIRFYINRI